MIRVVIALAVLFAAAQESKISIRLLPRANETVRFRMTQEMDMDISVQDSDPASADPAGQKPAPASATKMLGKTVFAFTQKTGAPDKEERLPVEVTYDQISVERSVNGVTTPGEGLG